MQPAVHLFFFFFFLKRPLFPYTAGLEQQCASVRRTITAQLLRILHPANEATKQTVSGWKAPRRAVGQVGSQAEASSYSHRCVSSSVEASSANPSRGHPYVRKLPGSSSGRAKLQNRTCLRQTLRVNFFARKHRCDCSLEAVSVFSGCAKVCVWTVL